MKKDLRQSSKTNSQQSQFASNISADLKNADSRNNKSNANSNMSSKTNRTDCK